ncbi:MAG: TIGR03435 family protein [Acidobacteriia bacterium]|nr:TIGR03435 family protein [Terriglobia bacterium]
MTRALAGFCLLALLPCGSLSQAQPPSPTFEVASVKPAAPPNFGGRGLVIGGRRGGPGTPDPERFSWPYASLKNILMFAYDVQPYQIAGPAWLDSQRYDLVATVPPGATKEQFHQMLQNLLAERFHLTLHRESKEFSVDELVVGKNGAKLKDTEAPDAPPPLPGTPLPMPKLDQNGVPQLDRPGLIMMVAPGANGPSLYLVAKGQTLGQLTNLLSAQRNRPVIDRTGLTGKYDFSVEYASVGAVPALGGGPFALPGAAPMAAPPGPGAGGLPVPVDADRGAGFISAIQQQLGLRLEARKAPLDVLVIDGAEKVPTEN